MEIIGFGHCISRSNLTFRIWYKYRKYFNRWELWYCKALWENVLL